MLAFVGLSQDIAFDSSDSSDGDMNINQDRLNVAGKNDHYCVRPDRVK